MKASISHILSFVCMILISSLILFISVQFSIRYIFIKGNLNKINYYNDAYDTITTKIDENIVNKEIKDIYKLYIDKETIKRDIKKIIVNKNYNITHHNEFYKIIEEYVSDKEIRNIYASKVDNIYKNNLFPIYEFKTIDKLNINKYDALLYVFIMCACIVLLEFIIFAINKNLKYNKISLLSSAILLTLPFVFIVCTNIFNKFIYTNKYYTKFLISIVDGVKNFTYLIGLIVIFIFIYTELIRNKKVKLNKNFK